MLTGVLLIICQSGRFISMTIRCLKNPLKMSHVKPLVVGHWGTTPVQNFIYVHLNRVIKKYDLDMFYIAGPGHSLHMHWWAILTLKAPIVRFILISVRTEKSVEKNYSPNSLSPEGFPAMLHPQLRDQFMKVASSDVGQCMPLVPLSTILI